MVALHFYTRRLRRIISHPAAQLFATITLLLLGINWVVEHNHDHERPRAPLARPTASVEKKGIDWDKLAYVQYATTPEYLCNAVMLWSQMEMIGSRAKRIMLYPDTWDVDEFNDLTDDLTPVARLLQAARKDYYVKLQPIKPITRNSTQATWSSSFTKLLAFNLTQYSRVVYMDSDASYQRNMDELFLIHEAELAMPWVYWGQSQGWSFSSQLMVISPSASAFARIEKAIAVAGPDVYDMDILHNLYPPSSSGKVLRRLPARPYNILSGEFRLPSHHAYISSHPVNWRRRDAWDAKAMLSEAAFLHFSDWPVPKPWVRASQEIMNQYMPPCRQTEWFGATDCLDRSTWLGLYQAFAERRKHVCAAGFELHRLSNVHPVPVPGSQPSNEA